MRVLSVGSRLFTKGGIRQARSSGLEVLVHALHQGCSENRAFQFQNQEVFTHAVSIAKVCGQGDRVAIGSRDVYYLITT